VTLGSARTLAALLDAEGPVDDLPDGTGVTFQRARVRPGDILFAWQGSAGHAIDRADEALAEGAAYVVSDVAHRRGLRVADPKAALTAVGREARRRLHAPVIGITGSAGKTTVKAMAAAALAARATPGNYNTPPGLTQAMFAAVIEDERVTAATSPGGGRANRPEGTPLVLELGIDHPGEMAELLALTRPEHAIVTTIGASHLSALGSVEAVAREKTALLAAAPGVRLVGSGAAPFVPPALLATCTVVRVVAESGAAEPRSSLAGPPDQVVGVVAGSHDGIATVHATGLGSEMSFTLPWTSPAMIENALLALTLATRLGRPFDAALDGLRSVVLEPGRLQWRRLESALLLDDSYNANPASAEVALQALRAAPRPWVAFLGDMLELGDASKDAHRQLGEATRDLDVVVFVGPESRAALTGNPKALHRDDAAQARDLVAHVPGGATVLVKGSRGMQMERVTEELLLRFGPEGTSERIATEARASRTEATS
jgi:UDP-N-acetylmuramoyl-tripeptide--D-alanyl-D-alanine ligase